MSKLPGKRRRESRAHRLLLSSLARAAPDVCITCGCWVPFDQVVCYLGDGSELVYCLDCALRDKVLLFPQRGMGGTDCL
jgi:hypothetical protein